MTATSAQVLHRLVSFRGRASRGEFWAVIGVACLALLPAFTTEFSWLYWTTYDYNVLVTQTSYVTGETIRFREQVTDVYFTLFSANLSWVTLVPLCIVVFPVLAALIRRLHDLGRPGWWAAVALFLVFGLEPFVRVLLGVVASSAPVVAFLGSVLLGFPTFVLSTGALIVLVLWTANEGEPEKNEFGPKPIGLFP